MSDRIVTDHRGFLDLPSVERYRLQFEQGRIRLLIPRNYLTHWYPSETTRGDPGFIGMATVPRFEGATADNLNCFGNQGLLRCDVVQFSYTRPTRPRDPSRTWWLMSPEPLVPMGHGLLGRPGSELMVYFGEDDSRTIQVACGGREVRVSCQMFFAASGANWRIIFPPKLLPQWMGIASGLQSLIEEFAAAAPSEGIKP
jgi:hypothetical protein